MNDRQVLSATAKVELSIAVVLVALFLYAREDLAAWLRGALPVPVQTSAHEGCRPPATEHEELHLVLAWRDGRLVQAGCLYVGSQSDYVKPRRQGSAHANAHE